jgi:hypothetical protein
MLFIVCTIIVIWFVFLALKPEKDKNPNSNNDEQKQTYLTPEEIEEIAKAKIEEYRKDTVFEILWKAEKMMNDMALYGNACDILKKISLYAQLSDEEKKEYQFYRSKRINKNCKNEIYYSDYQNDKAAFEEELLREESMNKRNVVLSELKNTNDDYDSPYDIDFEDDPFRRTEKIYALHEEAQEELDDYYDEEYELNSGLYDDDDNYNEYDNYDNNDNYDEYEEGQEDDLW